MNSQRVKHISECFIKPKYEVQESKQPYYLSPWDLIFLGAHYSQKGLLFMKPKIGQDGLFSMDQLLRSLKDSLALTLVHFYPLAGQLSTIVDNDRHRSLVFVDCNKGPGVRFVHATVDLKVSDILSSSAGCHSQSVVRCFFDHNNGEVNYDGHTRPLLTVQVTELVDGVFIGCSMNHVIVDGTSFWHFWNVWSDIQRADGILISVTRPPIHKRWVPEGYAPVDLFLPYIHPDEFIRRYEPIPPPLLREQFFHFSAKNVNALKAKVNEEIIYTGDITKISSFQALMSLVWMSIIRARGLDPSRVTRCKLAINNRRRLDPPLPEDYFGNSLSAGIATTTVGEMLHHGIGWAALLLNQVVANHTDKVVRKFFYSWFESPFVIDLGPLLEAEERVQVGSSPRFPVYENQFDGLGKPVAVRAGYANKFGGKVTAFPGYEGEGSVDLEICLPPDSMSALELDEEFMAYVSPPCKSLL
uniref:Shikimate O-hydroxycinnamoyltransferase n=1 Tax=Opuntia streptacantha TaxID=393608 RepID=A0A7C9ANH0_OPUST